MWGMWGWAGQVGLMQLCLVVHLQTNKVKNIYVYIIYGNRRGNKTFLELQEGTGKKGVLKIGNVLIDCITFCALSSLSRAILSLTLCLMGIKTSKYVRTMDCDI